MNQTTAEGEIAKGRAVEVVTTMTAAGYEAYGRRMAETFARHWPGDVPLLLYAEGFAPDTLGGRVVPRDLHASSPELVAFKTRHAGNRLANGRSWMPRPRVVDAHTSGPARRKVRLTRRGYRWQAVRFAHKVFAICHAAAHSEADMLIWIDADTRFFADVGRETIEGFVPPGRFVGCLRRRVHTECGFVAYDLGDPAAHAMLADLKALYTEDALFAEEEFHDSYLFDVVRARQEALGHRSFDIAEGIGAQAHHVLVNSKLGAFMDHMKGDRKDAARSRGEDLIVERPEAYWQAGDAR